MGRVPDQKYPQKALPLSPASSADRPLCVRSLRSPSTPESASTWKCHWRARTRGLVSGPTSRAQSGEGILQGRLAAEGQTSQACEAGGPQGQAWDEASQGWAGLLQAPAGTRIFPLCTSSTPAGRHCSAASSPSQQGSLGVLSPWQGCAQGLHTGWSPCFAEDKQQCSHHCQPSGLPLSVWASPPLPYGREESDGRWSRQG